MYLHDKSVVIVSKYLKHLTSELRICLEDIQFPIILETSG